jgi:hypothetical protein
MLRTLATSGPTSRHRQPLAGAPCATSAWLPRRARYRRNPRPGHAPVRVRRQHDRPVRRPGNPGAGRLPERAQALASFYERWHDEALVVDKWLSVQASSRLPDTLAGGPELLAHPAFDLHNPNKVYALLNTFGNNHVRFHAADGSGYRFLAAQIGALDRLNPQVAARLARRFDRWRKFDSGVRHTREPRPTRLDLFADPQLHLSLDPSGRAPELDLFRKFAPLDLVVDRRSAKPYHGLDLGKTYQPLIHSITSRSIGQTRFIRAKRRFHESTLVRRREDHGAEMRTFRAHFARRGTLAVNGGGQLLYEGCGRSSSSVVADYSQPASFDGAKRVGNRSAKPTTRQRLTSPGTSLSMQRPRRSLIISSAHQLATVTREPSSRCWLRPCRPLLA